LHSSVIKAELIGQFYYETCPFFFLRDCHSRLNLASTNTWFQSQRKGEGRTGASFGRPRKGEISHSSSKGDARGFKKPRLTFIFIHPLLSPSYIQLLILSREKRTIPVLTSQWIFHTQVSCHTTLLGIHACSIQCK
jgi:hypothetical protein